MYLHDIGEMSGGLRNTCLWHWGWYPLCQCLKQWISGCILSERGWVPTARVNPNISVVVLRSANFYYFQVYSEWSASKIEKQKIDVALPLVNLKHVHYYMLLFCQCCISLGVAVCGNLDLLCFWCAHQVWKLPDSFTFQGYNYNVPKICLRRPSCACRWCYISKPTDFSLALIWAPVSSYEGKKSKSNEGKKLGYTFWTVLLESSTQAVATSVNIHIGFSDTWYPFFWKPIGPETYSQHLI